MLLIAMLFVDLLFVKTDRLDATEYLGYPGARQIYAANLNTASPNILPTR